eukprot:5581718-Pleurochrysis_carterae.AAC.2
MLGRSAMISSAARAIPTKCLSGAHHLYVTQYELKECRGSVHFCTCVRRPRRRAQLPLARASTRARAPRFATDGGLQQAARFKLTDELLLRRPEVESTIDRTRR